MEKNDYQNWPKPELVKELKKLEKRKKYGIVWEDKPEEVAEMCKKKLPILEEVKSKEIKTDESKPVNIMIEGDNYHALSTLNYTHKGKVDVIYIDPPYNTGTKDFKYNDIWVDNEDAYRHSKWLSFMEKRLKLAKNLLKNSGLIFISIDDNEMAQLKLLMDDIFNNNFLSIIKLKVKAPAGVGQESFLFDVCEYVLVYAKDINYIKNNKSHTEELMASNTTDNYNKILESFGEVEEIGELSGGIVGKIKVYKHSGHKITSIPTSKREMELYYNNFEKIFRTTNPQGGLMKKIMPQIPREGLVSIEYAPSKGRNKGQKSKCFFINGSLIVWLKDSAIRNEDNKQVYKMAKNTNLWIENLHQGIATEGGVEFKNGKKPVKLIKKLVELHPNKNSIILDFFAGSGTSCEATMQLNKEDGGNRKYILCTDNEDNNGDGKKIAEDICYPRVKNATKNNDGGSLKYYKTAFVDAEPTDENKERMVAKSTEMLCLKEGCFDEAKKGKDFKIFNNLDKYLGIIYTDEGIAPFQEAIRKLNKKTSVYVFSLDESAREDEFKAVDDLVELKPIPAVILNVYKRIFV